MRFSLSWLHSFLQTQAGLDELAHTLTMAGIEVEAICDPQKNLADLTVARIITAQRHPNADRLNLCSVATIDGEKSIVCGADNVRDGLMVVYAPLGAYLPGLDARLDSKPRNIRGIPSHGMLCSERELCIGDDHDGIIELTDQPLGTPAARALGINDPILDIEVTPNRPDLLGVVGIARDLAATGIGSFTDDPHSTITGSFKCPIDIEIESAKMCPAFAGRLIRNVTNRPSPEWLQKRLRSAGSTPRNMLVDVTNYLSLARARPLHVYDADSIKGQTIVARTGKSDETCYALDGKCYRLTAQDCVIADASGAIGLGGIMGGKATAVSESTRNVFIESAWFDPVTIALTGRRHRIDSDARRRFERGVDPQSLIAGLEYASAMILSVCGGEPSDIFMAGNPPSGVNRIIFKPKDVERLSGVTIAPDRMRHIVSALGLTGQMPGHPESSWTLFSPSWRPDLTQSADVVEEILRIDGFDKIAPVAHASVPVVTPTSECDIARRTLAARGFTEALTWSFMEQNKAALFIAEKSPSCILANPVAGLDYMRPTILANLAEAVQHNANRGYTDVRLFEAGPVYAADQTQATSIAAVIKPGAQRHWAGALDDDAFTAKAELYAVLKELGIDPTRLTMRTAPHYWHPGRSATACLGPHAIAHLGQIHPDTLASLDVDGPLLAVEIDMSALPPRRNKQPQWQPRTLTPVVRDFAFIVSEQTPAGDIVRAISNSDKNLIQNVHVFDVYRGRGVEKEQKSVAVEVVIQPGNSTLNDAAIEALCQKIIANVSKRTAGRLRQ